MNNLRKTENPNNEHIFPKEDGWIVRREGNKKGYKLFKNKEDAMNYAGIVALNEGGSLIIHKYNGQIKEIKHGDEIFAGVNKISSMITGPMKTIHHIIN